jgi:cytochrome c biogenesis protein CcmG/thiol:disulfide interchange protein DsbE
MEQSRENPPAVQDDSPPDRGRSGSPPFGRRGLIIAAVAVPVLALLALLAWASATSGPARGGLAVNSSIVELNVKAEPAPEFTLALFGSGEIASDDLRGQVVMLDFWASWCPPCRDEAPVLAQVYGEYRERGVEFVGFNLWDNAGAAELFLQQQGHEYPNGVDEGGKIAISYGVRGIPEKFFLDREGRIVRKFSGPMDPETLRQILDTLLLEK